VTGVLPATRATWKANKTAREEQILQSLSHGFAVGRHISTWRTEIDWLFGLRGRSVHHKPEHEAPVYRPELDSGFSTEHVRYTAEAALRATTFALELIATCIRSPKPHTKVWAENNRHVADNFEAALKQL
jgi:hypothetical protein